jgi:Mg-chelatase subunit ChlD
MVTARVLAAGVLVVLLAAVSAASPVDLVVAIDQSGSMWGNPVAHPGKNDPWQHRIGATKHIVYRLIENAADTNAVHRFSIVEFADDAQVPLSGQVIRVDKSDPSSVDRVRALLETSVTAKDWGNTNTAAALDAALGELRAMRRSDPPGPRRRVVLLITDGKPTVPGVDNAQLRSLIRASARQLGAEGAELWVIGLNDADDYWTAGEGAFWEELAGKNHARLAENASAAMPSIVQDVVDEWLGIGHSRRVRGDRYDCPPYLRRIVFHVTFGRPRGDVRILDPDGNAVPRSAGGPSVSPGTFALFSVDDPKPGIYKIERDGSRSETTYVEELSAAVERLEPRGESDAGVETPLVFRARKASGDPLQAIAEFPIDASVAVTDSAGYRVELPAKAGNGGRFAATWKPAKPGRYRAVLQGLVRQKDGKFYDIFANAGGSYSPVVNVGNRLPYSFRLVTPDPAKGLRTAPWSSSADLRFELLGPDGNVAKIAGLVAQPDNWSTVQSLGSRGRAIGVPVPLRVDSDAQFTATVPIEVTWRKGEGTWSGPGAIAFRITAVPGHLGGQRYLRSIAMPDGLEDRRIAGDPLSAGPLDVRLALWLWALAIVIAVSCVALLFWKVLGRWVPSSLIGKHDQAARRTVALRVYDEIKDPSGSSAFDFGLNGRRVADLSVNLDVDGSSVNADRFRFVREVSDRRPRGTLQYRWRGSKRKYSTRLSAGDAKSLDGLPGGNYVALLVEQSQQ